MFAPQDWVKYIEEIEGSPIAPDEVQAWIAEFQYQGFDPMTIIKTIWERGTQAGKNKAEIIKDVQAMIILHLTRGNKVEKMKKKMSQAGAAATQRLITVYNLKEKATASTDLTLSRVAIVNAGLTCTILPLVKDHMAVTASEMNRDSEGYPVNMMHGSFASMIDPSLPQETIQIILDAHKLFLVRFSQKINPAAKGKSVKEIVDDNKQALTAALTSTFMPDDVKLNHLVKWNIVDKHAIVKEHVVRAAKKFNELL
uniref:Nucleoprotein n=1 Tax=Manawa virus TaxID=1204160 RepID=L7P662_9VIRU|nr:nonstructural protein [Manawa virus]